MKVYQTDGGYYFKEYKTGKKVRISQEQFLNFKKNAKKSKHSRKISKKCCKKMKGGGNEQQLINDLSKYRNINGTSNLIKELISYHGDDIKELEDILVPLLSNPSKINNSIIKQMSKKLEELKIQEEYKKYFTVLNKLINKNNSITNKNDIKQLQTEMLKGFIQRRLTSNELNNFIIQKINMSAERQKISKKKVIEKLLPNVSDEELKNYITSLNKKSNEINEEAQKINEKANAQATAAAEEEYNMNNNFLMYNQIINKAHIKKYFIDIQKYTLDTNKSKYLFLMEKVDILEHKIKSFDPVKKSEILYGIFDSVNKLIKQGYIYSDLKLLNIGYIVEIGGRIKIKLIDIGGLINISDIYTRPPPITLHLIYFAYISNFDKIPEMIDLVKVMNIFNKLFDNHIIFEFAKKYSILKDDMVYNYTPNNKSNKSNKSNCPKLIINKVTKNGEDHEQGSYGDVYLYDNYAVKIMKTARNAARTAVDTNSTANSTANRTSNVTTADTAPNTDTFKYTDTAPNTDTFKYTGTADTAPNTDTFKYTGTANNHKPQYMRYINKLQTGGNNTNKKKNKQINLLLKGMYRLIVYQLGLGEEYDKLYKNINNNNYDNLLKSLKKPTTINLSNNVENSQTRFTNKIQFNKKQYTKYV